MITKGNSTAGAIFSDCEKYRYRLWRIWDASKPKACFVMLNPSTATHEVLDPTVTRCKKRAETLGYGGLEIVNIFAIRSKDPSILYDTSDPVGHDNFQAIEAAVKESAIAICAWGSHGKHMNIGPFIRDRLMQFFPAKFHYLKVNADGSPTHPLYLAYELKPVLWGEHGPRIESQKRHRVNRGNGKTAVASGKTRIHPERQPGRRERLGQLSTQGARSDTESANQTRSA